MSEETVRGSKPAAPSRMDRALAAVCRSCPVCRRARKKGAGAALRIVVAVEGKICPFCRAYERVHGRKSHEPLPRQG